MISQEQHVYHPFQNSSLEFLSPIHSDENEDFILNDIDLYYQPLPSPSTATLFFVVRSTIVTIGELVHVKVYNLIQKENGLVNEVATFYICTQMFYVPFWLIFTTCTDFIHPINIVIGQWFCTIGWFIIYFCATSLAIHSFIVAVMRYFFIFHKDRAERIGKEKVKRRFLLLNILIPLMMVLWTGIESPETEVFSFLNKCYGKDHKRFLTDLNPGDVFKRSFCMLETFDKEDSFGEVWGIIRRISCMSTKIAYMVMGFNLTEGIMYYMILSQLNRDHKIQMFRLRKLMAESTKDRRNRCNILNIQIAILAWFVEFIGFLGIVIGSVILGHGDLLVTFSLQTFSMSIYFIILPYIYLINEQCNLKSTIADSDFYLKFIERFYQPIWKKEYKVQMQKEDEENDES